MAQVFYLVYVAFCQKFSPIMSNKTLTEYYKENNILDLSFDEIDLKTFDPSNSVKEKGAYKLKYWIHIIMSLKYFWVYVVDIMLILSSTPKEGDSLIFCNIKDTWPPEYPTNGNGPCGSQATGDNALEVTVASKIWTLLYIYIALTISNLWFTAREIIEAKFIIRAKDISDACTNTESTRFLSIKSYGYYQVFKLAARVPNYIEPTDDEKKLKMTEKWAFWGYMKIKTWRQVWIVEFGKIIIVLSLLPLGDNDSFKIFIQTLKYLMMQIKMVIFFWAAICCQSAVKTMSQSFQGKVRYTRQKMGQKKIENDQGINLRTYISFLVDKRLTQLVCLPKGEEVANGTETATETAIEEKASDELEIELTVEPTEEESSKKKKKKKKKKKGPKYILNKEFLAKEAQWKKVNPDRATALAKRLCGACCASMFSDPYANNNSKDDESSSDEEE